MHLAPDAVRAVCRDGVTLHVAELGQMAWLVAQFPDHGGAGTFAEAPCQRAHWGVVLAGDLRVRTAASEHLVSPGTAFHVPAGVEHNLQVGPRARVAGFEPLTPTTDIDQELRASGFEPARPLLGPPAIKLSPARPARPPAAGEIVAEATRMGDLVLTRTRFGRRAGYLSEPCDLPHWGIVASGSLAIEWEDAVEVLGRGDVFYCPAGPPGHRLEAAEPATVVDWTPIAELGGNRRTVAWRTDAMAAALQAAPRDVSLATAAIG